MTADCMPKRIVWDCPGCGTHNDDEIDPVYGPFLDCTCDNCGESFDQWAVKQSAGPVSG